MNLIATASVAGVALALALACGWMGARPAKALTAPRLTPWRLLMLVAFAVAVAALGHIVSLLRPT
jgi:hypothetical protein